MSLPLALSDALSDWADLGLRWLHVIAAMAWIGTSFYFVLLDQSLRPPKDDADRDAGVAGELWEVHGGGFYQVQKYVVAPPRLPDHVAWFKWEAYATWLSGFGLLLVLYYLDASSALVRPDDDLEPWLAVAISIAMLVLAWLAYDLLNRLVSDPRVLWPVLFALVALAAWGSAELFSPRAAWLQVGSMIGTVMAANVFFDIIPAHWELIRAKEAGREPDPRPGIQAKQRSVHNNYLTLPVLLTMLAGHFPFAYGADHAWLVLVALMLLGAWARLFFNLRHQRADALVDAGRGRRGVRRARRARRTRLRRAGDAYHARRAPPQEARIFASAGCGACHALADAGATGAVGPDLDASTPSAGLVAERVRNGQGAMPAFAGRLTDREIEAVAAYVASVSGVGSRADAPDQRRRVRVLGATRGGGRARDGRRLPRSAAARVADHPRPLVGRGGVDPVRRPRARARRRRTRPRTRTPVSWCSTPVVSPRPRSCSPTAT